LVGATGPAASAPNRYCADIIVSPPLLVQEDGDGPVYGQHTGFGGFLVALDDDYLKSDEFYQTVTTPETLAKLLKYSTCFSNYSFTHRLFLAGVPQSYIDGEESVSNVLEVYAGKRNNGEYIYVKIVVLEKKQSSQYVQTALLTGEPTQLTQFSVPSQDSKSTYVLSTNPISCGLANCHFIKSLNSISRCRFPPAIMHPAVGTVPTVSCCTSTCFADITNNSTANAAFQPTQYANFESCNNFAYGGGTYKPASLQPQGGVYCSSGCGYGLGDCLFPFNQGGNGPLPSPPPPPSCALPADIILIDSYA
jgi:hypothetical protein